jgi:hypothetical protein
MTIEYHCTVTIYDTPASELMDIPFLSGMGQAKFGQSFGHLRRRLYGKESRRNKLRERLRRVTPPLKTGKVPRIQEPGE